MSRWADYLVSAVRYDPDRRITHAIQHADAEDGIGGGQKIDRETLSANLKKGLGYCTIFSGGQNWTRGDRINLVRAGGGYSIRTDLNKAGYDNLRLVPEIE